MSGTTTTTTPAVTANDSLMSPQVLLGTYGLTIMAAVSAAVVYRGDAAQINLVLGAVFALGGVISNFFFGSSKSSQTKDATIAQLSGAPPPIPGTTVTTTGTTGTTP